MTNNEQTPFEKFFKLFIIMVVSFFAGRLLGWFLLTF
jgi:hypothetical protein